MKMKAAVFEAPGVMEIKELDYPSPGEHEVTVRVKACGLCGTDLHIFAGEFLAKFPVVPGHEFTGVVEEVGGEVEHVKPGDAVVVDNNFYCGECYYCRLNKEQFCTNFRALGVTDNGGFAEFVRARKEKVYPTRLPFEEAAFVEPTACAVHGLNKIGMKLGDEVLLFGAGPVGLILLQLLKHHGASTLVVCAPTEHKLRIAEQLGATEVVKLNKADYSVHASELKQIAPHGYDIVVDATGSPEVLEHAFEFLKCDSVLHVFGVYPKDSKICIRPYDIFKNDIRIIGTFAQLYTFTSALRILENNLIDVKPLVSHTLPLDKFGEALELMRRSHERLKILIKP